MEDLGSTNGITVNGRGAKLKRLDRRDVVCVGPLQFQFHPDDPEAKTTTFMDRQQVAGVLAGEAALNETEHRFRLFLELAAVLDRFESPEELVEGFGKLLIDIFEPARCILEVADFTWSHTDGGTGCKAQDLPALGQSVMTRLLDRGEALVMCNVTDRPMLQVGFAEGGFTIEERMLELQKTAPKQGDIGSAMGTPILMGENRVGFVYVDHKRSDRRFGRDDLLMLICLGRLVSSTLVGASRFQQLAAENRLLRESQGEARALVGDGAAMTALRKTIETRVGPVKASVLLVGETGTGKSMVADAIHKSSPRRDGPLIKVNCAAIPRELLESELFGHEKGAFSGADQRKLGQFELATGGTLFLDEVGELDPAAQAKLLTVIQDRRLLRVGGTRPVEIDVRLVAATNRNLKEEVEAGNFRADLYYRLNVVCLSIPPLRERRADVPQLAQHFLSHACSEIGRRIPSISREAMRVLEDHQWPGNVRELANCIERSVIFGDEGVPLEVEHLPDEVQRPTAKNTSELDPVALAERAMVVDAMRRANGNKRQAARLLGWYPQKLYDRIRRYGLDP